MPEERHSTLYLDDGDIVLAAPTPGTDITQLFRVHCVYLSHSSEIFRDMFAVATTSTSDAVYDGVPLLHLPHDDARDLATLFDVIYQPRSAPSFELSNRTFINFTAVSTNCSHRAPNPRRLCCSLASRASRASTWCKTSHRR